MKMKNPGLEAELERSHRRIIALGLYADWWAVRNLGHELFLTDVEHTDAEYDLYYAKEVAAGTVLFTTDQAHVRHYAGPKPHRAPSHAADFGILHDAFQEPERLTPAEAHALADHLNEEHRPDGKPTAIIHDVGTGVHLHVQAYVG